MGNWRAMAASLVGAVIDGRRLYLLHGRRSDAAPLNRPALDDVPRELNGFRSTIRKAVGVASEGSRMLNNAMGGGGQQSHCASARQSSLV
jgi:hypothetical protein